MNITCMSHDSCLEIQLLGERGSAACWLGRGGGGAAVSCARHSQAVACAHSSFNLSGVPGLPQVQVAQAGHMTIIL